MEIKYNVQAPPKKAFGSAKSEEVKAIEDFLSSGNAKNMCFEYETAKEAKSKRMWIMLTYLKPAALLLRNKQPSCLNVTLISVS